MLAKIPKKCCTIGAGIVYIQISAVSIGDSAISNGGNGMDVKNHQEFVDGLRPRERDLYSARFELFMNRGSGAIEAIAKARQCVEDSRRYWGEAI